MDYFYFYELIPNKSKSIPQYRKNNVKCFSNFFIDEIGLIQQLCALSLDRTCLACWSPDIF